MYKQASILVAILAAMLYACWDGSQELTAEEIMHEQLLHSTIAEVRTVMPEGTRYECLQGAALIINGRYAETEPLQRDFGLCMRIAVRAWNGE